MRFEKNIILLYITHCSFIDQGRVVRKPVNVNPGLNVNCNIVFSCFKMFFTSNVLCSLRLLLFRTEEQTMKTDYLTKKLQN